VPNESSFRALTIRSEVAWESQTLPTASLTASQAIDEGSQDDMLETLEEREAGRREIFEEIDNTLREQKAVKADNAEVPEFLWFNHLVDDGPSEWRLGQQERLAWAMEVTRARMLCWWKRILARSFWEWMKQRHEGIREASKAHSRKLLVWDEDTRKYSWSGAGQASYRLWWDGVVKETWVDFEAGLECIERAWNAS
jgi:hypothetical protein